MEKKHTTSAKLSKTGITVALTLSLFLHGSLTRTDEKEQAPRSRKKLPGKGEGRREGGGGGRTKKNNKKQVIVSQGNKNNNRTEGVREI